MFNFHKPRVYRSADGCCICRAKSSSSRFTASRKYEKESMQCFNLQEPRNGEICNACVLLVKRYKRLPTGSKRHWGHVVDARAGPGTKSLAKQKKRENECEAKANSSSSSSFIPEKFAKIFKKNRKGKAEAAEAVANEQRIKSISPSSEQPSDSNESYDEERAQTPPTNNNNNNSSNNNVAAASAAPYQTRKRTAAAALAANSNGNNNSGSGIISIGKMKVKVTGSKRRRMLLPVKHRRAIDSEPFFDEHDLLRLEICCGIVFQSLALGSHYYIIDPELYKPCEKHRRRLAITQPAVPAPAPNPTPIAAPAAKVLTINHTPALKKHHLFFKRQSESFPHGDINRLSPVPLTKTEALPLPTPTPLLSPTIAPHSKLTSPALSLILKPATVAVSKLLDCPTTTIMTTTAVGAASPSSLSSSSNCSTSSSVATKFNDNSSDSGFDEHVLERKSVSPPTQEDLQLDRKKGAMHRLILASGLPITGQTQNLVLAGNEFTARFVQQRQTATTTSTSTNPPLPLKLNVLGTGSQGASGAATAAVSCNKMRAIFNQSNTIQHENGVTTILPASSLAASNQTAAMNAIAPSTVTITPASVLAASIVAKKIAMPLTTNNANNANSAANAAPKIILLKPATTAKFVGNNNNNTMHTAEAKMV